MHVSKTRSIPVVFVALMGLAGISSCGGSAGLGGQATAGRSPDSNPLLEEPGTPFGVPAFDRIRLEHFEPAFRAAMDAKRSEISAIVENEEPPTFENTVEALDRAGVLLDRVDAVFHCLNSSATSDEMQAVAKTVAPSLSALNDDINLDPALFARIEAIHAKRHELGLDPQAARLLDEIRKGFVRGGANLPAGEKERFRRINEELSVLTLEFGENVLKETKKFKLIIDDDVDLAGLPAPQVAAAAEAAQKADLDGKWVFTIDKSSLIPFLQFSERRALRRRMFEAYTSQGDHGDELDNKARIEKIISLRIERAGLLGFDTHADFVLDENMAKTPAEVFALLDDLWKPALETAKREATELAALMKEDGVEGSLEPWDWWYYAERLRQRKYDLEDEELRPYFELERVRQGAFDVARGLWGIEIVERSDLPKYHEDVRTFEVREADGTHVGVFYADYYTRTGTKRGGAWMSSLREQHVAGETAISPIVTNNCNFQRPTADAPTLLSMDEVETLFHEFGHALHGLLSSVRYRSLSGTAVARDFVELPSQIMENWARDPAVLALFAKHHETGAPMPDELVEKIRRSARFNQGFDTVEYLAASYLDMDWHTLKAMPAVDPAAFEAASLARIGLIPEIVVRYRSTYFQHVFAGVISYSAGYYSYVWAQVLDADAFAAFEATGDVFDQKTARAFRDNVLAAGNTADPMELYRRFRGKAPSIDALLARKGFAR